MLVVNLWDTEFAHTRSVLGFDGNCFQKPTKIEYVRNQMEWDGITLFTNNCLHMVTKVKSKYKIAWMCEARPIFPSSFQHLEELESEFDYIFTWYRDLLEKNPQKYKCILVGSTRIPEAERQIHPKTKLCSLLVSKQMTTPAHKFRHILAQFLENYSGLTIFGPNHTPYPTKVEPHKDFMFSIVIMNSCEDYFFTEYLIDCLLCGSIPIFYGCPSLGKYFNMDGILHFTEFNDVLDLMNTMTPELYYSKLAAIKDNFERAKQYVCTDDMLADILLKIAV